MRSMRRRIVPALVVAGVAGLLGASPALADPYHKHGYYEGHHRRRPPVTYYRSDHRNYEYDRHYYYSPRPEYYAPPLYVPQQPSGGITLVFPFPFH